MGRGDREAFDPSKSEIPGGPIPEHQLWSIKWDPKNDITLGVYDSSQQFHRFHDGEQFLQIGGGNDRIPFIRTKEGVNIPFEEWAKSEADNERSEAPVTPEALTQSDHASDQIFGRVYEKFSGLAKLKTTKREPVIVDGVLTGVQELPTDPIADFVKPYFEGADRTKVGFAGRNGKQIMEEYQVKLATNQSQGTIERGGQVLVDDSARITDLIRTGAVDALTAQTFVAALPSIRNGLSFDYNALTLRESKVRKTEAEQEAYKQTITKLYEGKWDRIHLQPDAGFIHINSDAVASGEEETAERFYICGNPDRNSAELVKAWAETLDELGLADEVYYKLPIADMTSRYEQMVVYKPSGPNGAKTDQAILRFSERCDPALLSDEPMPTGVEQAKGIFAVPEPAHLNTVLRYATREGENFDHISYNQFIAASYELAMRRAAMEITTTGGTADTTRPRDLRDKAAGYFAKFMVLSGIDPATMKAARAVLTGWNTKCLN